MRDTIELLLFLFVRFCRLLTPGGVKAVGQIPRKHKAKLPFGDGPSWLTFLGHMKDSLWSIDLFRCESMLLKSHWVMVIIEIFKADYRLCRSCR